MIYELVITGTMAQPQEMFNYTLYEAQELLATKMCNGGMILPAIKVSTELTYDQEKLIVTATTKFNIPNSQFRKV